MDPLISPCRQGVGKVLDLHISVSSVEWLEMDIGYWIYVMITIYLSIYLSVYLSICLSVCLSVCLSIYQYLSIHLSVYLSINPSL